MKFQVGDIVFDHNYTEPATITSIDNGDPRYPIQTSNGSTYTLDGRYYKNGPIILTLVKHLNKDHKVEHITSTSKLITLANGTQIYDNGNYALLLPSKGILE